MPLNGNYYDIIIFAYFFLCRLIGQIYKGKCSHLLLMTLASTNKIIIISFMTCIIRYQVRLCFIRFFYDMYYTISGEVRLGFL